MTEELMNTCSLCDYQHQEPIELVHAEQDCWQRQIKLAHNLNASLIAVISERAKEVEPWADAQGTFTASLYHELRRLERIMRELLPPVPGKETPSD